jgi:hypothetical protein
MHHRLAIASCLICTAIAADPPTPLFEQVDTATAQPHWLGSEITAVAPESPAAHAGAHPGDLLVAVDGWRVHDRLEVYLLNAQQAFDRDSERWLVSRGGAIVALTVDGVLAWPNCGIQLSDITDADRATHALAALGVAVPAADRDQLDMLPSRVAHALDDWRAAQHGPSADPPWVHRLIEDYLVASHGEGHASAIAAPIPVPSLARADRFWRTLIDEQTVVEWPALSRWGCDACYATLFFPYPHSPMKAFGAPRIQDATLARLLQDDATQPGTSLGERDQLAQQYASQGGSDADIFMGEATASLLDAHLHGGWPFRSYLVADPQRRQAIVTELKQRWSAGGADADRAGYALIGPLILDGAVDEAGGIIAELKSRSPYLGLRATVTAHAAVFWNPHDDQVQERLNKSTRGGGHLVPASLVRFFTWSIARSPMLAEVLDGLNVPASVLYFHQRPELVAQAIGENGPSEAASAQERLLACNNLNNIAWRYGVDATVADSEQAKALGEALAHLGGVELDPTLRDTIAADWARCGDFAAALRWQRGAIDGSPSDSAVQSRLGVYRARTAYSEGSSGGALAVDEADPGGGHRQGWRAGGTPVGAWRWLRADGSRAWSGAFDANGRPEGDWRQFDAAGKPELEVEFRHGKRYGWIRAWRSGTLVIAGWYGGDGDQPIGRWTWSYPGGARHESGLFVKGVREGIWSLWTEAGATACDIPFHEGRASGVWPGSPDPELPEVILPSADAVAAAPAQPPPSTAPPTPPAGKASENF